MRAALGLVSLLVGAAIVAYLWSNHTQQVLQTGGALHTQANQIAGVDSTGKAVDQLISTVAEESGGRLKDLLVKDVTAASPWQTHYGLRAGDKIVSLNAINIDLYDGGLAQAQLVTAYQGGQPIGIIRDGKPLTLPLPAGTGTSSPMDAINRTIPK